MDAPLWFILIMTLATGYLAGLVLNAEIWRD